MEQGRVFLPEFWSLSKLRMGLGLSVRTTGKAGWCAGWEGDGGGEGGQLRGFVKRQLRAMSERRKDFGEQKCGS